MFALPGLACMIFFMYLRPQEYYTILQKLPLLYIFFAMTVGGLVIDLRLRLIKPVPTRTLPLAVAFYAWLVINNGIVGAGVAPMVEFTIMFVAFFSLCHAVQSFQALRIMAGTLATIGLILTIVGVHQARAPYGCILIAGGQKGMGVADGRGCETVASCLGVDAEPGADYECERVGLFGTAAIQDRVRYRGSLQDPNELSVVVVAAMPLLIAFMTRKRRRRFSIFAILCMVVIFDCIINTQSRGGMIIYLGALGVYFLRKYGMKYIFLGVFAALPLMAMGGRSGAAADASTEGRYEAWRVGLQLLQTNPVLGAGHDQFTQYHHLTAHNSYVLAFAELGLIGFLLWFSMLYMSIKVPVIALRDLAKDPRAGPVVEPWAMAIIGMSVAYVVQMMFLSLTYHAMTWMFFGFSGAFYSAVKRHRPDWHVKIGVVDLAIIATCCLGFIMVLPVFLALKGF